MRISCVIGPYFPVPPLMGGAVERIFLALAVEFARLGHTVTMISRRFDGLADDEMVDGVRHLRIQSRNAPAQRIAYRLFDLAYAMRACVALPASDVTITHSVSLPLLLPKSRAGRIYVSVARFPKGQMGFYRRADRLQAVSTHVAAAIRAQTPSMSSRVKVVPNALSAAFVDAIDRPRGARDREILFVGRLAKEKGIDLLVRAFVQAADRHPDWRLTIIGPHLEMQGGDGEEYLQELKALSESAPGRVRFVGPIFSETELIAHFERAEIFVYPSIAERGESFGMAPLEAMACGCAVITSSLECFRDFLRPDENGLLFDHTDRSAQSLATALRQLMASETLRRKLAKSGRITSRGFAPSVVARRFIDDFESLLAEGRG